MESRRNLSILCGLGISGLLKNKFLLLLFTPLFLFASEGGGENGEVSYDDEEEGVFVLEYTGKTDEETFVLEYTGKIDDEAIDNFIAEKKALDERVEKKEEEQRWREIAKLDKKSREIAEKKEKEEKERKQAAEEKCRKERIKMEKKWKKERRKKEEQRKKEEEKWRNETKTINC